MFSGKSISCEIGVHLQVEIAHPRHALSAQVVLPTVQPLRSVGNPHDSYAIGGQGRGRGYAAVPCRQRNSGAIHREHEVVVNRLGGGKLQVEGHRARGRAAISKRIRAVERDPIGAVPEETLLPRLQGGSM